MSTNIFLSELGFKSTEAFLNWQLTRFLLERSVYLQTKIQVFKQKYKTNFTSFETEIENSETEITEHWDDSIIWEALEFDLAQVNEILAKMEIAGLTQYSESEAKICIVSNLVEA